MNNTFSAFINLSPHLLYVIKIKKLYLLTLVNAPGTNMNSCIINITLSVKYKTCPLKLTDLYTNTNYTQRFFFKYKSY